MLNYISADLAQLLYEMAFVRAACKHVDIINRRPSYDRSHKPVEDQGSNSIKNVSFLSRELGASLMVARVQVPPLLKVSREGPNTFEVLNTPKASPDALPRVAASQPALRPMLGWGSRVLVVVARWREDVTWLKVKASNCGLHLRTSSVASASHALPPTSSIHMLHTES